MSPEKMQRIASERRGVSLLLSAVMLVLYFGFILLGAFAKPFMGTLIMEGVSVGILLGALVIVAAFALTAIYVRWANTAEKRSEQEAPQDEAGSP